MSVASLSLFSPPFWACCIFRASRGQAQRVGGTPPMASPRPLHSWDSTSDPPCSGMQVNLFLCYPLSNMFIILTATSLFLLPLCQEFGCMHKCCMCSGTVYVVIVNTRCIIINIMVLNQTRIGLRNSKLQSQQVPAHDEPDMCWGGQVLPSKKYVASNHVVTCGDNDTVQHHCNSIPAQHVYIWFRFMLLPAEVANVLIDNINVYSTVLLYSLLNMKCGCRAGAISPTHKP